MDADSGLIEEPIGVKTPLSEYWQWDYVVVCVLVLKCTYKGVIGSHIWHSYESARVD